jgi:NodT family efflux transporter outer membrane factor (OMF) lipoprotein
MATDRILGRRRAAGPGPRRRRAPLAALAAAVPLAGCMTAGPDFRPPEPTPPATWAALEAAGAPSAAAPASMPAASAPVASRAVLRAYDGRTWWAVFQDPVLDGLVDEALRQNLDLQAAALRIEEARAQLGAARAQGLPAVSGSGLAGRQRSSTNGLLSSLAGGGQGGASGGSGGGSGAGAGGGAGGQAAAPAPSPYSDLYDVGFDATWELDLWGKARRGVEAARAGVESAQQARGDAMISLTAEVARTYLALRGYQRERAIALAQVEDERRLARLVGERSRHGFAAEADAVTQQAQLSAAIAQLPPIDARVDQAANRLALLLALPPGALAQRLGEAPAAEPPLPPEVPVGLPGDLLRRRPDVARSEADLHAATAKLGQAKAQLFPSITLGAFGGLQATHAGDLLDWASRFWVGGAQVSIPIFEGGKLKAQIRTADAQMREAALQYRGTVLSAYHDANDAITAYAQEQRHAAALARQLADARRSRDLMRERWQSGLVSLIEVLDAQRQLHQAELQALQSRVAASTDLVALYKALGGDWDPAAHSARR